MCWSQNVNSGVFEPKYSPNYRIIAIYGNNHIAVKAPNGKAQVQCRRHIKRKDPVDKVISLLPNAEDYQKFRRKTKLLIHPNNILDMNISLPNMKEARMMGRECENSENCLVPHKESTVPKNNTVKVETINCIDCLTTQK